MNLYNSINNISKFNKWSWKWIQVLKSKRRRRRRRQKIVEFWTNSIKYFLLENKIIIRLD